MASTLLCTLKVAGFASTVPLVMSSLVKDFSSRPMLSPASPKSSCLRKVSKPVMLVFSFFLEFHFCVGLLDLQEFFHLRSLLLA